MKTHASSTSDEAAVSSRAARQMAIVMPYARDWQETLWSVVSNGQSANVTLRVTVADGEIQQVQQVRDRTDKPSKVSR